MKTLYLVRHAKSSWKDSTLSDFERPLNKRGKRDAPLIGAALKKSEESADKILSSPAKRTQITAQILSDHINFKDKIDFISDLYLADSNKILEVVRKVEGKINNLMVVGHNPGLTDFANLIGNNFIENIPTCGVLKMEFDGEWKYLSNNNCKIKFFIYPKLLSGKTKLL